LIGLETFSFIIGICVEGLDIFLDDVPNTDYANWEFSSRKVFFVTKISFSFLTFSCFYFLCYSIEWMESFTIKKVIFISHNLNIRVSADFRRFISIILLYRLGSGSSLKVLNKCLEFNKVSFSFPIIRTQ